jgi:WD40 repeat protein
MYIMNGIINHVLGSGISRFTIMAMTLLMVISASAKPVYHDLNQIIFSVAWSPDGTKIAIGRFGRIELINSSTGITIRTLTGSGGPITAVDWSSDSTRVAGASANPNGLAVWDANSGQMILSRQHDAIDLAWSPDNTQIAFASMQGGIALWNISSGQINIPGIPGSEVQWSPDGTRLATADYQLAPITVINLTTSQQVFTLSGHTDGVERIAWSDDGTKIASGGSDNEVRVWNATTGASLFTFTAHTGLVTSVAWNSNNTVIASGSSDGTIRLWDTQTGQAAGLIQVGGKVRSLAWSPSGNKLVYGGDAGIATIIDYPSSTGRGLRGTYYALNNLTGLRFFRLSNQINFNWAATPRVETEPVWWMTHNPA